MTHAAGWTRLGAGLGVLLGLTVLGGCESSQEPYAELEVISSQPQAPLQVEQVRAVLNGLIDRCGDVSGLRPFESAKVVAHERGERAGCFEIDVTTARVLHQLPSASGPRDGRERFRVWFVAGTVPGLTPTTWAEALPPGVYERHTRLHVARGEPGRFEVATLTSDPRLHPSLVALIRDEALNAGLVLADFDPLAYAGDGPQP